MAAEAKPQCSEEVWEPPGYWHSHRCTRKAKWEVKDGPDVFVVCGIHVKHYRKCDIPVTELAS